MKATHGSAGDISLRVLGPLSASDPRVVDLLRQTYLDPPSTLPYNLSLRMRENKSKYGGSWGFIHNQTEKLFGGGGGHRRGFFIEAGALEGERASNTLLLEQELGWIGLLVEPVTVNYRELSSKHRKAWTSNTCLSPEPFPKESVMVALHRKKFSIGVRETSHYLYLSSSHLLGFQLDTDFFPTFTRETDETYSKVQCFPLVSYLLALNVSTLDFLSLDIEGAEKNVLQHFPWDTHTIRALVVENVHQGIYDREFVEWMKGKGYALLGFQNVDYFFVRRDDPDFQNRGVIPT